jgi:isoleucyl-tRNA synthetase
MAESSSGTGATRPVKAPYEPARPDVSLPQQEEEVLAFWDRGRIFERTLEESRDRPHYSFYDGPPFATGLPHYGHLLAGTLKDIVPRYWTMRGYHVPRRFGWDCHGLPVEYEINKKLEFDSNKQIRQFGIGRYNAECRAIVQRYTEEWKRTVRRIGRWVDMDRPYFTMDASFMQSVWWGLRQLWDKGLIYEGYKVVPYSVGVSTPLSNFEANLNYKEVQDPAITVALRSTGPEELYFLAWTTTPWTLPSNLALAVGRDLDYARVRDLDSGKLYVVAEALAGAVFKERRHEIVGRLKGAELLGTSYQPLFDFFADRRSQGAFQIIHADHVTVDAGTGIVHMAPAFGEEDYQACSREGLPVVNPVDDDGMFTDEVPDWAGQRVKDADRGIIARLKAEGKLFRHDTIVHSYPFCWRSDTPLIYRAVATWFVKVEAFRDELLACNATTSWVPEHLRDGRFGNWLANARDWAISRNRFWGTPLPIWRNDAGETVCIGSIAELEERSGQKVTDLHLDAVSGIEIRSARGGAPLRQTGGVLDCWLESGSMPFAQWGYPFHHKEEFEKGFPAEFIAEGLDQTRGWFYTLMVMGTALFARAPFRNVVVNGLILAEDGKKMSKSLRNYPDPGELLDQHGADALRLYLIDSPVVKAQELRFSEKGVRDIVRKILLRWWNAYSFFVSYGNIDGFVPRGDARRTENILDRWILSRLHSLIGRTNEEMSAYRLYNVVPGLLQFIEELTNTYIRFNRSHFWREGMPEDKRLAYETLYEVLLTLARVMAPFTPFVAETMYRNLSQVLPAAGRRDSVHLTDYPQSDPSLLRPELEQAVARMSQLVLMGRNIRETIGVKAKIPLQRMRIIHREPQVLDALRPLEPYFVDELNVREVVYEADEDRFVAISTKANFPRLGPRLGKQMKPVAAAIAGLRMEQILALERGETIEIGGERITLEDVEIRRQPRDESATLLAHQLLSVELDGTVTEDQVREGLSREVIRRIQATRKRAALELDDRIELELSCSGALREAVEAHADAIREGTLALGLRVVDAPRGDHGDEVEVDGMPLGIALTRRPPTS